MKLIKPFRLWGVFFLIVPLLFPALVAVGKSQFPYWIVLILFFAAASYHRRDAVIIGALIAVYGTFLFLIGEDTGMSITYGLAVGICVFWSVYFSRLLDPRMVALAVKLVMYISLFIGFIEIIFPNFCGSFDRFNSVRACSGRPSAFYNEPSHIAFLFGAFLCLNNSHIDWREKLVLAVGFFIIFPSGTVFAISLFWAIFRVLKGRQWFGLVCCLVTYYGVSIGYLELRDAGLLPANQSWDKRTLFLLSSTMDWADWIVPSFIYDLRPLYTTFYLDVAATNPELTPDVLSEGVFSFSAVGTILQAYGGIGVLAFLLFTKKTGNWGFAWSLLILGYPVSLFALAATWSLCREREPFTNKNSLGSSLVIR